MADFSDYDADEWDQRKIPIKERDQRRCRQCGTKMKLLVHHLNYPRPGQHLWEVEDLDLKTLCPACHDRSGELLRLLRREVGQLSLEAQAAILVIAETFACHEQMGMDVLPDDQEDDFVWRAGPRTLMGTRQASMQMSARGFRRQVEHYLRMSEDAEYRRQHAPRPEDADLIKAVRMKDGVRTALCYDSGPDSEMVDDLLRRGPDGRG